jgi:hypothetical protein
MGAAYRLAQVRLTQARFKKFNAMAGGCVVAVAPPKGEGTPTRRS